MRFDAKRGTVQFRVHLNADLMAGLAALPDVRRQSLSRQVNAAVEVALKHPSQLCESAMKGASGHGRTQPNRD